MRLSHVKNHYTSEGQKTVTKRKVHKNGNWVEEISYYLGNVALKDGHFHALMHAEGRLMKDHNGEMHQEYFIKDHLGNVSVHFEDGNKEVKYSMSSWWTDIKCQHTTGLLLT